MVIVGITGSFGTGKTTVAKMLEGLGAEVIDADKIAHQILKPKTRVWKEVVSCFGQDILTKNKSIDRARLAEKIFGKKNSLAKLNRITHPIILERIKRSIERYRRNRPNALIVIDAPLLIESGLDEAVDRLIVVRVSPEKQITRCIQKTHLSDDQVRKRIDSQLSLGAKEKQADFIIDNDGPISETKKQVARIWKELEKVK